MNRTFRRPRAVFFGTPDFAATSLGSLLHPSSPVDVVGVVTRPDTPVGRRQVMTPPPVKVAAADYGIPVIQPHSLRRPSVLATINEFEAVLGLVVAYGRILPITLVDSFKHGCVNVHGSLLPRWRGAWPIGAAIAAGDRETGVTIMRLDAGMDTGPVLTSVKIALTGAETTASLEPVLATLGGTVLCDTLRKYLNGEITPIAQEDDLATYCRPVTKGDGAIRWEDQAVRIERHVRAMHDWPGAWSFWGDKRLSIRRIEVVNTRDPFAIPGTVEIAADGLVIATGDGAVRCVELVMEGRSPTTGMEFARGYRSIDGATLISEFSRGDRQARTHE